MSTIPITREGFSTNNQLMRAMVPRGSIYLPINYAEMYSGITSGGVDGVYMSGTTITTGDYGINIPRSMRVSGDGARGPGTIRGGVLRVTLADLTELSNLRLRGGGDSGLTQDQDSLQINQSRYVLARNLSVQFSTDECLGMYDSRDVSISHSIIGPALDRTNHSMGALLRACQRVSFTYDLFAHIGGRAPQIHNTTAAFIGCVWYNSRVWHIQTEGDCTVVLIGNTAISGPNTLYSTHTSLLRVRGGHTRVFMYDNMVTSHIDGDTTNRQDMVDVAPGASVEFLDEPPPGFMYSPATIMARPTALNYTLSHAGARPHDTIDTQVKSDVINRTGGIPVDLPPELQPVEE